MTLVDGLVGLILLAGLLENRLPAIPLAAMGVVSLRGLTSRITRGLGFKAVEWSVVACLAYWLANYFWSTGDLHNLISFQFLRNDGAPLVTYPLLIFLLGWRLKPKFVRGYWLFCVFVVSLLGLIGSALTLHLPYAESVFGWMGLEFFDRSLGTRTFFGWYHAHNTGGGVFALTALLPLAFLQVEELRWNRRAVIWAMFLACVVSLLLTYSRGSYLGFLTGAAFIIPVRKFSKVVKAAILLGVPMLSVMLFTSSVLNRIDTITDPHYGTNAARFVIWGEAIHDFELSPLIGIGFGRFNDDELDFKGQKGVVYVAVGGRIENNDGHAHNSFLHFLAEGGIVGMVLTVGIWWWVWKEISFFQKRFPKSKLRALHCAAKAWIPAIMVMSMTEHILGRGSVILLLMSLSGLVLASSRGELEAVKQARDAVEMEKVEQIRRGSSRPVFSRFDRRVGASR
ncbi:MAG TPA: O-antigen ligase family protein [Terriglobia bacterium]|nr:O-antigen ligase family protein [Terriglobia bacterium]